MSEHSAYTGHSAIVFGSTSGIGAATALLLAERGAAVTVVGRREEQGTAVVERCAGPARPLSSYAATSPTTPRWRPGSG